MRKIIALISVILLLSVTLVFANSFSRDGSDYLLTVELREGWNLVQGLHPDVLVQQSEITKDDIKAVFLYSPDLKKYIELYPSMSLPTESVPQNSAYYDEELTHYAFWVYSSKTARATYKYDPYYENDYYNNLELKSGWNLVGISPAMIGNTLNAMKGNCDWKKIYMYAYDGGQFGWGDLLNNPNFVDKEALTSNTVGMGLAIKVDSDCRLSASAAAIAPPPTLPN